jgi:hypothetical protein
MLTWKSLRHLSVLPVENTARTRVLRPAAASRLLILPVVLSGTPKNDLTCAVVIVVRGAWRPDCISMRLLNFPLTLFVSSLVGLWLSTRAGVMLGRRARPLPEEARDDYNVVLTATVTLLGLIIGFTFSFAINRYDQRKNYEAEETNAIGTEYVRADLLPAGDAAIVKGLLRKYIDQRVLFYTIRDSSRLSQINASTAQLQRQMWSAVQRAATAEPSPTTQLAASGMNDVLNSQGYTQAAWLNRTPKAAWMLMIGIAACCTVLIGYGSRKAGTGLLIVLPIVLATAFFLIADVDSPRQGLIRVFPQNLTNLAQSLVSQN